MRRDLRETPLYREIEEHLQRVHGPGFGRITGAADAEVSPDGRWVAFTGTMLQKLEGTPISRVCLAAADGSGFEPVTAGPNSDHLPRWSPDGSRLAFLSDRAEKGRFQLHLLRTGRLGEAVAGPLVGGTAESLAWSPDGARILVTAAEEGAELPGVEGSGTAPRAEQDLPEWMPEVRGVEPEGWRRAWVADPEGGAIAPASREGLNVWEADWLGPEHIVAIASESPDEDAWYHAPLVVVEVESGKERVLYESPVQLGVPAGSPSGRGVAVLEAICSDRGAVAGDLLLVDPVTGEVTRVDTAGVDVTSVAWRDDGHLLVAGVRGLETVVAEVDAATGTARERWSSPEGCGTWHPSARPMPGGFVVITESWDHPPAVTVVRDGRASAVATFEHEGTDLQRRTGGALRRIDWESPDGTRIDGLLVTPEGEAPFPLVVAVHGGPVWAYQDRWGLRRGTVPALSARGYAVLLPNPRGGSGRGQEFAGAVYGDMGGGDAADVMAGVDALIARGLVDPGRIGVTGGSYGGFMTCWLVTQTDRFAAAVAVSPVTNWYSQHLSSNIGLWDRLILGEDLTAPDGEYFRRSPVMHAGRARTPTLLTAGLQDRCTPAGQAVEFHQALREHGVETELALYPQEGHGVRQLPTTIDFLTRTVAWFERHMPART